MEVGVGGERSRASAASDAASAAAGSLASSAFLASARCARSAARGPAVMLGSGAEPEGPSVRALSGIVVRTRRAPAAQPAPRRGRAIVGIPRGRGRARRGRAARRALLGRELEHLAPARAAEEAREAQRSRPRRRAPRARGARRRQRSRRRLSALRSSLCPNHPDDHVGLERQALLEDPRESERSPADHPRVDHLDRAPR